MSSSSPEDFSHGSADIEAIIAKMELDFDKDPFVQPQHESEKDPLQRYQLEYSDAQDVYLISVGDMMDAIENDTDKKIPALLVEEAEEDYVTKLDKLFTQIFETNQISPLQDIASLIISERNARTSNVGPTENIELHEAEKDDLDTEIADLTEMLVVDMGIDDNNAVEFQIHLLRQIRDEIQRYYRELIGDAVVKANIPQPVDELAGQEDAESPEPMVSRPVHTTETPVTVMNKRSTGIGKAALGFIGGAIAANYIGKRFKNS